MDTATLTSSNTSFIITDGTGTLNRTVGNKPVVFPVGTNKNSYTPITITNEGATDSFGVRVADGVRSPQGTTMATGQVNKTWYIGDTAQSLSKLKINLQWNAADEQPGLDRNFCYVSQLSSCPPPPNCVDGYYDFVQAMPASGSDPYSITRDSVILSSFHLFVISSMTDTSTFTDSTRNGDWNNPANWTIGLVPANVIPKGKVVIINPAGGVCNLQGDLIVEPGGQVMIMPGKKLHVTGKIILE